MAVDFQVTGIRTKHNHVFMRSHENGLYLFSGKEKKPVAMVDIKDAYGHVQMNPISTDFGAVYLVVTTINATSLQFRFYEVKNDSNAMVGSENVPHIRDPFEVIEACANRLKQQFDKSFGMLTKINAILPKIRTTTKKAHFPKITVNNAVTIKRSVTVGEIKLKSDPHIDVKVVEKKLQDLQNRTRVEKERTDQLVLSDDPTPRVSSLNADSPSLLIAKTIRVKNLQTSAPLFSNLITKTGRNFLKGHLTVGSLIAPQLHLPSGVANSVQLSDLYVNSQSAASPVIRGKKIMKDLKVNRLTIDGTLNGVAVRNIANLTNNLSNAKELRLKKVRAQRLTVERINGVHVSSFFRDYYRGNDPLLTSKIQGNLLIRKPIRIANLQTGFLNRVPVTDYFTLKSDQNITRKVIFNDFFVRELNAKLINGIEFGKTVAVQGEKNFIETPVRIHQMRIGKKLILSEQENREMTQHIVGTRVEDLTQTYSGRVIIRGNLILHNVTLENPVNLFLEEKRFPLDSFSEYWTKDTSQRFNKNVHLKGRVETTQLLADNINHHPANGFVTTDQGTLQTDSSIHFKDTIIERNIRTQSVSKILEISRNAVRKGEKTLLEGTKRFENVTTLDLISSHINSQQISNHFFHLNTILACDRRIKFEELHLQTDIEYPQTNLQIDTIDGVNMHSLFADAVYTNRPIELVAVQLDQFVTEADLNVDSLNGVSTSAALERINNLKLMVNVTGTAKVQRLIADTVNGVHVNDYLQTLVLRDRGSQQDLGGHKKFLKGFTVTGDFRVKNLSGIDVQDWMRHVLHRDKDCDVTEEWVFKDVQMISALSSTKINEMPTELMIDANRKFALNQDLDVNELIVENGHVLARGAQNWSQIVHNLRRPLPRKWQRIEVTGDIFIPEIKSKLGELITHGMNNRQTQAIHGELNFRGLTKVRNLYTHNKTVCGIDLGYVLQDTLLDNSQKVQIVEGPVVFENGFEVNHLRATTLDVKNINGINMKELNQSLWRPSSKSPFPPLHLPRIIVERLNVKGNINGYPVSDFNVIDQVQVHAMRISPNFTVQGNLQIDFINGVPFDSLFLGRARLTAREPQVFQGSLTVENLVIRGKSRIQSINGIPIRNLLWSQAKHPQDVSGIKGFSQVYFSGPSSIVHMNNALLSDRYKTVVDKKLNHRLEQFNAKAIVAHRGLEIRKSLNDIPIEFFRAEQPQLPNIKDLQQQLKTILAKDANFHQNQKRFNYFDYTHNVGINHEGNDTSHLVLNRYTSSECRSTKERCLCKRQVEIQLSKFNEIQVNPSTNLEFDGHVEGYDIKLSVNNSCDPDKAFTTIRVDRHGDRLLSQIKGSTQLLGTIPGNHSSVVFLTATELKENLTITIWGVSERDSLRSLRRLSFGHSKRSAVHLMKHKENHLLVISTRTTNERNPKLTYVYLYDHQSQGIQQQHILRNYYDLFSSVGSEKNTYLAAALTGDKLMDIYKVYQTLEGKHQLSSRIPISFDYPVKDVLAFQGQDQLFIAALLENGLLYIYRYNFVEVMD